MEITLWISVWRAKIDEAVVSGCCQCWFWTLQAILIWWLITLITKDFFHKQYILREQNFWNHNVIFKLRYDTHYIKRFRSKLYVCGNGIVSITLTVTRKRLSLKCLKAMLPNIHSKMFLCYANGKIASILANLLIFSCTTQPKIYK